MIRIDDLKEAIAECEGQRNPNASTCIKLAAFYTILNQMQETGQEPKSAYSFAAAPPEQEPIGYNSESDFGRTVYGKDPDKVMATIDEMMDVIQGMSPRLYAAVLEKLAE